MKRRRSEFGNVRRLPSGRWQARWSDDAGLRHNGPTTFATEAAARAYLQAERRRLRVGEPPIGDLTRADAPAVVGTVGVAVAQMLDRDAPGLRPSTLRGYQSHLRNQIGYIPNPTREQRRWVAEGIAHLPLADLSRREVRDWLVRLRDRGLSRSTVRKALAVLRLLTSELVADGVLERDPCAALGRRRGLWPPQQKPRHLYLATSDIDRARGAFPLRYAALIEVLAWGGLRIGEAFALTREDIDLNRGVIHVYKSQDHVGSTECILPTKNNEDRYVSLGEESRQILRHHLDTYVAANPDARLFTTERGRPLRYSNFRSRIWKPAVTAAGFPGLKPHDLRSTCATNLFSLGWSPRDVQQHLGHKDAVITLRIYTEFIEASRVANVKRIDDIRRRAAEVDG